MSTFEITIDYDRSIYIRRVRGSSVETVYNGTRLQEAILALRRRMKDDLG